MGPLPALHISIPGCFAPHGTCWLGKGERVLQREREKERGGGERDQWADRENSETDKRSNRQTKWQAGSVREGTRSLH